MTEVELSHFENKIITKSEFSKSFIDDTATDNGSSKTRVDDTHRTSTFLSVQKQADAKIASLERKAADLLGLCTSRLEPLQLVRYRHDQQFFNVHHDLGLLLENGKVELPPKQSFYKRRIATIFCYLNDVKAGGCTHFPACGNLRVKPKRGRAVLFLQYS